MPCQTLENISLISYYLVKILQFIVSKFLGLQYTFISDFTRSNQYVFLGFVVGYKRLIGYDIHKGKFIISTHVIHDEDVYPFKKLSVTKDTCSRFCQRSNQTNVVIQVPVHSHQNAQNSDNRIQEENYVSDINCSLQLQVLLYQLQTIVLNYSQASQMLFQSNMQFKVPHIIILVHHQCCLSTQILNFKVILRFSSQNESPLALTSLLI